VARVWHEGAVIRQERSEKISKNILEQQKKRADDGNRTRMTSLEGSEYGSAEQRRRRSGGVFDCPWVTVNHPGSLCDRARNGHAVRPARDGPVVAGL
jgi:hypothetical protein